MKKFLTAFALAGLVGISACAAEDTDTEIIETPAATTPPAVVDPAPLTVDSVPPLATDTMMGDTVAP